MGIDMQWVFWWEEVFSSWAHFHLAESWGHCEFADVLPTQLRDFKVFKIFYGSFFIYISSRSLVDIPCVYKAEFQPTITKALPLGGTHLWCSSSFSHFRRVNACPSPDFSSFPFSDSSSTTLTLNQPWCHVTYTADRRRNNPLVLEEKVQCGLSSRKHCVRGLE